MHLHLSNRSGVICHTSGGADLVQCQKTNSLPAITCLVVVYMDENFLPDPNWFTIFKGKKNNRVYVIFCILLTGVLGLSDYAVRKMMGAFFNYI